MVHCCVTVRDPTKPNQPRTYGWWVGRTFQPMYYWGGAAPGSFKCSCGLEEGGCAGTSTTCNCDAGLGKVLSDQGEHSYRCEGLGVLKYVLLLFSTFFSY